MVAVTAFAAAAAVSENAKIAATLRFTSSSASAGNWSY
jgi:hypothetical protein